MFMQAPPLQKQKRQETVRPNPTGIPSAMKSQFEDMSGLSFDDVRVHYSSDKPAQLRALAYTQGRDVYVSPGQERHLGHELGHIVQQKQGRVAATARIGEAALNDDPALEAQADRYAHMAAQSRTVSGRPRQAAVPGTVGGVVQRYGPFDPENYKDATSTQISDEVRREIQERVRQLSRPLSNSEVLRLALTIDGQVQEPEDDNQAHHIVETSDGRAQDLLDELEIDSNAAINGVFLPQTETDSTGNATPHYGSHTKEYADCVYRALCIARDNAEPDIGETDVEAQRNAVIDRLQRIRIVLLENVLPLNAGDDVEYSPENDGPITMEQIFEREHLFDAY